MKNNTVHSTLLSCGLSVSLLLLFLCFPKCATTTASSTGLLLKRKLSKKANKPNPKDRSIEGVYLYGGCSGKLFKAIIECGRFGSNDPDLCKYTEHAVGEFLEGEFKPFGKYIDTWIDPKAKDYISTEECILEGTFRSSAVVTDDGYILQIPLATSNGCNKVTENFQFVMKGKIVDDELRLLFSNDFGNMFPYEGKEVSPLYNAIPIGSSTTENKTTSSGDSNNRKLETEEERLERERLERVKTNNDIIAFHPIADLCTKVPNHFGQFAF